MIYIAVKVQQLCHSDIIVHCACFSVCCCLYFCFCAYLFFTLPLSLV